MTPSLKLAYVMHRLESQCNNLCEYKKLGLRRVLLIFVGQLHCQLNNSQVNYL